RLLFTCTAEVLTLNLLISPLVWPHHFVFVMPLAVFAVATAGRQHPMLIGAFLFLTFMWPWSDVFILGYHRLAGVAIALAVTAPHAAGTWTALNGQASLGEIEVPAR